MALYIYDILKEIQDDLYDQDQLSYQKERIKSFIIDEFSQYGSPLDIHKIYEHFNQTFAKEPVSKSWMYKTIDDLYEVEKVKGVGKIYENRRKRDTYTTGY